MSSARALKKNINELIKSVQKWEQSESDATPWKGIDKVQQFLVKYRNELASHPNQLIRLSDIQKRQVQHVALNLHHLSISVCLNLDGFDQINEDKEAPESHARCTNFVNRSAQFIISDILNKKGICYRTLRMEFWIAVLNTVFKMGDLQAAGIILTALNNVDVSKLSATYQGLSPQAKKVLAEIKEFAFKKRSLIVEERTTPIVPAFDAYMRHFVGSGYSHDNSQLLKYKNELKKLQAELQFALIDKIINDIISQPKVCTERIEHWVIIMREAFAKANFRKVLIILNALNTDEVKNVSSGFRGVSFEAVETIEEITALMRKQQTVTFDSGHFIHLSVDDDFQPLYFDYDAFTSGDGVVDQDNFDKETSKIVKALEPNSALKPSPILREHYPVLLFPEKVKLKLNGRVKNRLKQEELNNEIMEINGDKIFCCLRWLQDYAKKTPHTKGRKQRQKQIKVMLAQFAEVTEHVSHLAHKGPVPDIEEHLRYLEDMLADPDLNRHGRTGFVKKWLGRKTELALKLEELKEALAETKKLADEQAALKRKYNKKYREKLNHCLDLMASLSTVTTRASIGFESGEQTLSDDLDISTVVLTISSSDASVSELDSNASSDKELDSAEPTPARPSWDHAPNQPVNESRQPTSTLIRFFENKAKRNSLVVLHEVSKSQRREISAEINGIIKLRPITSMFAEKHPRLDHCEEIAEKGKEKTISTKFNH